MAMMAWQQTHDKPWPEPMMTNMYEDEAICLDSMIKDTEKTIAYQSGIFHINGL